jgi:hypothetical protein
LITHTVVVKVKVAIQLALGVKKSKGLKTRHNKRTDSMIIHRRTKEEIRKNFMPRSLKRSIHRRAFAKVEMH